MAYINRKTGMTISSEEYESRWDKSDYFKAPDKTVNSAIIGAVTDSALLGGLLGGSIVGGVLGGLLDGDLFD